MITVSQRHPRAQVNIVKNNFNPAAGEQSSYELTTRDGTWYPHQDVLDARTHKDVGEVAGTFQIKLTARRDGYGRMWSHLIDPMDYVEIRMASDWTDDPQQTPIIMRGFVDSTTTVVGTAQDGSPQTYCMVSGRDYGKLFLRTLYYMLPTGSGNAPTSNPTRIGGGNDIAALEMGLSTAVHVNPKEWIKQVVDVTMHLATNKSSVDSGIADIPPGSPALARLIGKSLDRFSILYAAQAPFTGSIWNYLSYYVSSPFFEMFVTDDAPAGTGESEALVSHGQPTLVWRRSPFKNFEGKIAAQDQDTEAYFSDPDPISYITDIIDINVHRGDDAAFNYFLCMPAANGADDQSNWILYGAPDHYAKWRKELTQRFGFIPLEAQLQLWPESTAPRATATETENNAGLGTFDSIVKEYSSWLNDVYGENYLYESGRIVVKGNPNMKIGRHLKLKEEQREFYIEGVDHIFTTDPLSFITNVTVTRGRWPKTASRYTNVTGTPDIGLPYNGGIPPAGGTPGTPGVPGGPPAPPTVTGPPITTTESPCNIAMPIAGMPTCTQAYGETALEHPHAGLDFDAAIGTPLYAAQDGVLSQHDLTPDGPLGWIPRPDNNATSNNNLHYGNMVVIAGSDGNQYIYGHLTATRWVHDSGPVKKGDLIGYSGSSGWSTGGHLHFEIRRGGTTINPAYCLPGYLGHCPDGYGNLR